MVPLTTNPLPWRGWGFTSCWWRHFSPLQEGATFYCFPGRGTCHNYCDSPPFFFCGARKSDDGDVRASPRVRRSHSVGSPSFLPVIASFEWVKDDVLKYNSSITFATSVTTLQCQVKFVNHENFCKIVVQACRSDEFPFLRAASDSPPFFFMYRCLFEVLGLILPLNVFQCAQLEHLNMALS